MSDIVMLEGRESQAVLQTVVDKREPAIMSYLSKDKWHVAKVLMTELSDNRLYVEGCHSGRKPHPVNIRLEQPVGVNFKHAYGKFVFDTTVVALEPSADPDSGGVIVLNMPDRIGVVQRRSYFRVNVPDSLRVNVVIWHRTSRAKDKSKNKDNKQNYFEGRLMDISAGGAQILMPLKGYSDDDALAVTESDFRKGQFIGVRFTPMPYETPLMFSAQIRNVLPTAERDGLSMGLQIVGLEASDEGRQVLSRLATVVDRYYHLNQGGGHEHGKNSSSQSSQPQPHLPAGALQ